MSAEGPLEFARLRRASAQEVKASVYGLTVELGELRYMHRRQVCGHVPQKCAESSLTHSRTDGIAVSHCKQASLPTPDILEGLADHDPHRFMLCVYNSLHSVTVSFLYN